MKLKNVILPIIFLTTLTMVFSSCEDKGKVVIGKVPSVKIHQLNIAKHSLNFSYNPQSEYVNISSTSTAWELTDIPSWISVSPSTGSDGKTDITVSVRKNEVATGRVGVITLRSLEGDWNYSTQLTVTQERCRFNAIPQISSIAFDGIAGSISVPVVSNTDTWTVSVPTCASSWCSAAKDGNSIKVTVSANTSDASRSVSIEVTTGESCEYVSVTQRPANISSTTELLTFPVGGGAESIQVQAEAAWTARTSYSWIDVAPQAGQSGTTTVSVQTLANNTTKDRTGYVYLELSDKNRIEIPVQQEGIYLSVDKTDFEFPVTASSAKLNVLSNAPWKFADGIPEWITVTPTGGTGNAAVTVSVTGHNSADPRQAKLSISPTAVDSPCEIDIFQAGHILEADSTSLHFSARAGQLTFNLESDAQWVVSSSDTWISVSPTSGSGNRTINVSVLANESETARTGSVVIGIEDKTVTVPVYQAGGYITVTSKALDFTSKGGSTQVCLSSDSDWKIESGASWLTTSVSSGSDNASVTITASDNPSSSSRSSKVTVTSQGLTPVSIVVSQASRYLRTSVDTLAFFFRGGTSDAVLIETDGVCEITNTAPWITVNRLSSTQFTVTVPDYTEGSEDRKATLTLSLTDVTSGSVSKNIIITQSNKAQPQYVDLGLSVKWATFNVGAAKPEEYGDYFAWGETSPKDNYSWSTYKYCKGSDDTMTKYCTSSPNGTVDNKTVLDLSDDAAHVNWGGSWRMPTIAEFVELCNTNNCTWEWTTINGVNGYKVVSKKSGYAGNWIFLPAAGYRYDTSLYRVGSYGIYWSSSLGESLYYFDSGYSYTYYYSRCYGLSVRPVFPVSVTGISLDKQSVELMEGCTETLNATVSYENGATGNTATWSSSNTGVATVDDTGKITAVSTGTCTVTATVEGFSATCTVTVKPFEPEYVDLGLSVKWATFNVGASRPEDYGDYFAWGETSPKYNYSWSTYKYCKGSYYTMTKYCTSSSDGTVDNKTVLDLSDDAAHVNWGGSWRMPTGAEFEELQNSSNCTWTWTSMNGVNGYKVVSKKSGYAGNWIFLPAAGCRSDSYLSNVGSLGGYWSSSLYWGGSFHARDLGFGSGCSYTGDYDRYYGQSVRPVFPVSVTGISLDKQSVELMEGCTETLNATVSYENGATAIVNTATWTCSNTGVATVDDTGKITAVSAGTCTITATVEGVSATCTVTVKPCESGYEYVDLGLSVKWATCNVGASRPEDYGDYFAWGETSPKSNYSWPTYKYCKGSYDTMTKYCTSSSYGTVDNKTVLDLSDDAAHVNWGGSWRMPTGAEFDELLNSSNCTWTWTTMNGVNGYKVVSKKSGYAGNWIFLPAAGWRNGTSLGYAGSRGYYWSGSLNESYSRYARYLFFYSDSHYTSSNYRYYGYSVRPVFR